MSAAVERERGAGVVARVWLPAPTPPARSLEQRLVRATPVAKVPADLDQPAERRHRIVAARLLVGGQRIQLSIPGGQGRGRTRGVAVVGMACRREGKLWWKWRSVVVTWRVVAVECSHSHRPANAVSATERFATWDLQRNTAAAAQHSTLLSRVRSGSGMDRGCATRLITGSMWTEMLLSVAQPRHSPAGDGPGATRVVGCTISMTQHPAHPGQRCAQAQH